MNGEKKELLVIGKSNKPRCFKGVKMLPVQYKINKNAWMTATMFEEWAVSCDQELEKKHFTARRQLPCACNKCETSAHKSCFFTI